MDMNLSNIEDILNNLNEGAYIVDLDRNIIFWNSMAEQITGYKQNEIVSKNCADNILKHIDNCGNQLCLEKCPLVASIEKQEKQEKLVYLHHKNGHRVAVNVKVIPVYDKNKKINGAIEIFNKFFTMDSTKTETLIKSAMYDFLTNLPNRAYLENEISFKINEVNHSAKIYGLFFVDIDNFKSINDDFGHNIGDIVIKMVSKTLRENIRSLDIVGRWGGEEFVGILSLNSSEDLYPIIEKLRILIENSELKVNGIPLSVTVSIGGTIIENGDTSYKLVDRADKLMYLSKKQGKNKVKVR